MELVVSVDLSTALGRKPGKPSKMTKQGAMHNRH